ncbi:hypothetical protein LguiA_025252 [Lonicera macranthoides]
MASATALILSVLISTAVICIAIGMKVTVPSILDLAIYKFPLLWSSLLSWLKPPYLYVVINAIILTIVASSKFYHRHDDEIHSAPPKPQPADLPQYAVLDSQVEMDYGVVLSPALDFSPQPAVVDPPLLSEREVEIMDVKPVVVNGSVVLVDEYDDEVEISSSIPPQTINSPATRYLYSPTEKPLISSRFSHRKPVKTSLEGGSGRALRVAKPKRHETLENTWKTITEGRHVPLTRHLRKSDTLETHVDATPLDPPSNHQEVNKSETFKDRTKYSSSTATAAAASSSKLRREPSPSQEELNRRVEAFIKKFNEDMRLQRQESLNQYQEMINRGAH